MPIEMVSAEDSSLEYLRSLSNYKLESILYDDTLTCSLTNNKEIGSFEVKVSQTNHGNIADCIEVIAQSQATIDDVLCGTTIRAIMTRDLQTLHQEHTESVQLPNPVRRHVRFVTEGNHYVVTLTHEEGKKITTETKRFAKDQCQGLILEGANLILQRLMVQRNMPQKVTLLSLDSSSELCENIYTALGPQKININGKDIEGWGIQRQLMERKEDALPVAWQTYFNIDGHLLTRHQVGSPIKMKTKTLPTTQVFDEYLPKPTIPKKTLKWEEDLELRSKFLDRREDLIDDYKSYIYHHPDINALLADFLQSVLITKPENIIEYAAEFFAPYNLNTSDRSLFRFADEKIPVPHSDLPLK